MVKLNFDGLVSNDKAAATFVLRNCDGHVVRAGVLNLDGATITFAEVMGLKEGLKFAWSRVSKGWLWRGTPKFLSKP